MQLKGISKMIRATRDQILKAKEELKQGKGPAAVAVSTGISLAKAKALHKELQGVNPVIPVESEVVSKPQFNQVKTSLMSEEDIKKYGQPTNIDLSNVPKELTIEIGPVGISLALQVLSDMLEPFKIIGVKDICILVTAGGAKDV